MSKPSFSLFPLNVSIFIWLDSVCEYEQVLMWKMHPAMRVWAESGDDVHTTAVLNETGKESYWRILSGINKIKKDKKKKYNKLFFLINVEKFQPCFLVSSSFFALWVEDVLSVFLSCGLLLFNVHQSLSHTFLLHSWGCFNGAHKRASWKAWWEKAASLRISAKHSFDAQAFSGTGPSQTCPT